MPAIYAVRGVANTGKTRTVRECYQLLRGEYSHAEVSGFVGRVEINAVLTINGVRVGIKSQGDPGTGLRQSLEDFKKRGCEIIICATRTYGETVAAVEALNDTYEIIWRRTTFLPDRHQQNLTIAQAAQWIVNQIRPTLRPISPVRLSENVMHA